MEDIRLNNYNQHGEGYGVGSSADVDELLKALEAGEITGRDTADSLTDSGAPLKAESLENSLKVITHKEKHAVVWKEIPKLKAYNTVEEYNQLVNYGLEGGAFTNEGELPEAADTVYRRKAELVKFMGTTREVTHPMQLVRLGSGISNIMQQETENGAMWIMKAVDKGLAFGNSDMVDQEFNGFYAQHQSGVQGSGTLDSYQDSEVVIDLRGKILKDEHIEAAAQGIYQNYGMPERLIAPPRVFSNYVKNFHESKLIQPILSQVRDGIAGQQFKQSQTQFGQVDFITDIFWGASSSRLINSTGSVKAPGDIVPDGSTPQAAVTDTLNRFLTAFAGDYWYAVAARNRYGEGKLVSLNATALTIATTESADLKFADGAGAYPATSYVIYRSKKSAAGTAATAPMYPIYEVSTAQLAAGYDGAAATLIRDRNRFIEDTDQAYMAEWNVQILSFKQLAPMMKMNLATLAPSSRFMVLLYGTPILYAPKKSTRLINIGTDNT